MKTVITLIAITWVSMLFMPLAAADSIQLTCTLPTQNEDGSELTDLDGTRYYEANVTGGPYALVYDETDATLCGAYLERPPGEYFYVAAAYNESGIESVYSGEATKVVSSISPEPPTDLVTNGNLVAYAVQMSFDVVNTYPVGTVAAGVECDPDMSVNGFHRVPVSAVVFAGDADAKVAVAECGAG